MKKNTVYINIYIQYIYITFVPNAFASCSSYSGTRFFIISMQGPSSRSNADTSRTNKKSDVYEGEMANFREFLEKNTIFNEHPVCFDLKQSIFGPHPLNEVKKFLERLL